MKKLIKRVRTIDEFDVELFNKLGIGVEIQDFTEPNFTGQEIKEIVDGYKEKFKGFSNLKSLHGPFLDLKPASPDLEIRRASIEKYDRTMEIAKVLDLDYVIFHSQVNPQLNDSIIIEYNTRENKKFFSDFMKRHKDFKGRILIENIFEENPRDFLHFFQGIEVENMGIILDIGHSNLTNYSLDEWIETLTTKIEYMHIHQNDGKTDQHQAISKENVGILYRILDRQAISPVLALEYNTNDLELEINKFR